MAKTYSDPELGRMPNVGQTGLNQAAAASKKMRAAPAMMPNKSIAKPAKRMMPGAQGNAQSTRMMAPSQRNLPLKMGTQKAAGVNPKALNAGKKAFNKMKGRSGKKIPI